MKFIWLLLNLSFSILVFSQELTLVETFTSPTPINTWTIDGQNNLLVVSENNIQKKAINGEQRFNQTFKSLGNIQSILPINAMKILLFSELQQSVTIVDNTLTQQGELLDLSELGFSNVSHICVSNRPNLIWVFDQFRSNLCLVDFNQQKIVQQVQNSLQDESGIVQMIEYHDQLYVLFQSGKVKCYDFLLNYVETYELPKSEQIQIRNNTFYLLNTGKVETRTFRFAQAPPYWSIPSNEQISSFYLNSDFLGIQKGRTIFIYRINKSNKIE
jgi:hypothetical protein